jgi:hypothetical protein
VTRRRAGIRAGALALAGVLLLGACGADQLGEDDVVAVNNHVVGSSTVLLPDITLRVGEAERPLEAPYALAGQGIAQKSGRWHVVVPGRPALDDVVIEVDYDGGLTRVVPGQPPRGAAERLQGSASAGYRRVKCPERGWKTEPGVEVDVTCDQLAVWTTR